MVLTNKQKNDLHAAILEYCEAAGFAKTAAEFTAESGVAAGSAKGGVLEKKWSAVLRQQKKISDLEKKVKEMQEVSGERLLQAPPARPSPRVLRAARRQLLTPCSTCTGAGQRRRWGWAGGVRAGQQEGSRHAASGGGAVQQCRAPWADQQHDVPPEL